jgi:hypothetical protein
MPRVDNDTVNPIAGTRNMVGTERAVARTAIVGVGGGVCETADLLAVGEGTGGGRT